MGFDITGYEKKIDSFYRLLKLVPEKYTSVNLAADKWSLKEIVGHLLDSASNNHQRFVRLQADAVLAFPGYDQELWIRIQRYNDFEWDKLAELWALMNSLLVHLIKNMDDECLGHVWNREGGDITLEGIIIEYFRHMGGHIEHFEERLKEIKG